MFRGSATEVVICKRGKAKSNYLSAKPSLAVSTFSAASISPKMSTSPPLVCSAARHEASSADSAADSAILPTPSPPRNCLSPHGRQLFHAMCHKPRRVSRSCRKLCSQAVDELGYCKMDNASPLHLLTKPSEDHNKGRTWCHFPDNATAPTYSRHEVQPSRSVCQTRGHEMPSSMYILRICSIHFRNLCK